LKYLKLAPWFLCAFLAFWGYGQHQGKDKALEEARACRQAVELGLMEAKTLRLEMASKDSEIASLSRKALVERVNAKTPDAIKESPESLPASESFVRDCLACQEKLPLAINESDSLWKGVKLCWADKQKVTASKRKWKTIALVSTGMLATLVGVDVIRGR